MIIGGQNMAGWATMAGWPVGIGWLSPVASPATIGGADGI